MTDYAGLRQIEDRQVRTRTIEGLKRLRQALAGAVPAKTTTDTLLLATWNIREFDSGKYGYRSDEPYYYIAEILSRFDLIAVQEVRDGLYPLQRVKRLLGAWWDYIVTDVTLGTSGNAERMAYLFDRRKVNFTGLAAELVLPKDRGATGEPLQLARSPYIAGFQAGWAYLTLVTVHIYYGASVAVDPRRLSEITALANTIATRARASSPARRSTNPARGRRLTIWCCSATSTSFAATDVTMTALNEAGFIVPAELQQVPGSNVERNKHYDQIAYLQRLAHMAPSGKAGVLDFYECVYRLADEDLYAPERTNRARPQLQRLAHVSHERSPADVDRVQNRRRRRVSRRRCRDTGDSTASPRRRASKPAARKPTESAGKPAAPAGQKDLALIFDLVGLFALGLCTAQLASHVRGWLPIQFPF